MSKTDLSLMDAVHAWTFQKKALGRGLLPGTADVQLAYRVKLRQAQRFVVDDDSVRLVCRLSHELDRLPHWALLARLPYDIVWFEFDLHVKVREFEVMHSLPAKFNPDEVAERIGYLMFRDTRSEDKITRWICHGFVSAKGVASPEFLAYVYDPEGDARFPTRGSQFWRQPTWSLRPNAPRVPILIPSTNSGGSAVHTECDLELLLGGLFETKGKTGGYAGRMVDGDIYLTDDEEPLAGPAWLTSRMAVIVDPWWDAHLAERLKTDPDRFNQIMFIHARENRGHLRWIVTLLAAINGLPKDIQYHHARTGKHSVGMYQLPFFGSSTISIGIPRENRLIHARKLLNRESRAAHRRRHSVIGHWRIVERGKLPAGIFCRHIPTLVEGSLAVCERCGLLVRYIESFERGDATLGYVQHKYVVTKEK